MCVSEEGWEAGMGQAGNRPLLCPALWGGFDERLKLLPRKTTRLKAADLAPALPQTSGH